MPKEKVKLVNLPSTGLLRINQILQFVPISRSCWWSGVKAGRFPQPIKLSIRVTAWRAADIQEIVTGHPADISAELTQ
jgi:predicted DNA-binding transcriptional regulator AlpA